MSLAELLAALPEAHKKHLDPASPLPMRMMASKGLVPAPPRDLVVILCGLSFDTDEKLSTAAHESLGKLPEKVLGPVLDGPNLPELALGVLCRTLVGNEELLEKIVVNRRTPDDAIAAIAKECSERIAEIVSGNQERCLRAQPIVEAVRQNPNLLRSSADRLFDFLVRAGCIYEGMPEFADAIARLSPAEMQETIDKIALPEECKVMLEDDAEVEQRAQEAASTLDLHGEEEAKKRIPMLKLVQSLNASQKIALAIRGNREARTILVRDSNRVVAGAAIRSPRITEQEVLAASKSRSVSDEVIRIIANSKEMAKSYAVKMALVQNPKTPMQVSMRFLTLLREADVRGLAKNKNVPQAVANQARRLMQTKDQK
jgi:hypothetical protein